MKRWNNCILQQHEPHVVRLHGRTLPVVQVILQESIARTKQQLVEDSFVFHQIQGIEHIGTFVAGQNQQILHQIFHRHGRGHVVIGIHRVQLVVQRVVDHGRWQVIKGTHVRDFPGVVFDDVSGDDAFTRHQHVLHFFHTEFLGQLGSNQAERERKRMFKKIRSLSKRLTTLERIETIQFAYLECK